MPVHEALRGALTPEHANADIERIYRDWDTALSRNDTEALLALYAPDAVIESPLIPHVLGTPTGICRGHAEIKRLLDAVAARKPKIRQFYRTGYFTDGKIVVWEYPRATPSGEQMDFVEVMEIRDGLISRHRVYWGWYGFEVIKKRRVS